MSDTKVLKTEGAEPFVTKVIFRDYSGIIQTWESRLHRKGIKAAYLQDFKSAKKAFWNGFRQGATLNWWISILFALGSFLFILGSLLSLWTPLALYLKFSPTEVNFVFFWGSIPFTSAAFLQLLQAYFTNKKMIKSIESNRERKDLNLTSLGFLSALFQFAGTLFFNVNTFEATRTKLDSIQTEILVWIPDFIGSLFFLISGYLAFIEVGHSYWKWERQNISWWVVFINLMGCFAFMVSAIFTFIPRGGASDLPIEIGLLFTLIGAFFFFVGALLMLPEMGVQKDQAN